MLPEIISISKDYNQRRSDYECLFSESLLCKNVNRFWGDELDMHIGNTKWRALWQMSEENCIRFETLYPAVVVVNVSEVIFHELSAIVSVEEVQEDIDLPGIISVPIFELYPIKDQPLPRATLTRIADYIDRCRYFFLKLWYPWDITESITLCEWADTHLNNRMKLQNDMQEGIVDHMVASHIKSLISEALEVEDALENDEESEVSEERKLAIIKNLFRKENIKLELNLFEAPDLRESMIVYLREKKKSMAWSSAVALVDAECTASSLSANIARLNAPSEKLQIFNDAEPALEAIEEGGTVVLTPGNHFTSGLGNLSWGGKLKGLETGCTVLAPKDASPPRFLFMRSIGPLLLENLSIQRREGVIITISDNVLTMNSCRIDRLGDLPVKGIVVQSGCKLIMNDCVITGCTNGIILKQNATAVITNCNIINCNEGIKMMDKSSLELVDGSIVSSTYAAVTIETSERGYNVKGALSDVIESAIKCVSIKVNSTSLSENMFEAVLQKEPMVSNARNDSRDPMSM